MLHPFTKKIAFYSPLNFCLFLSDAICLLFISSGVTMSVPFALGRVIDTIYGLDQLKTKENVESTKETTKKNLDKLCSVLIVVFAIGGLANFGRVYWMRIVAQNITARLRNQVFGSIVKQETAFFDKTKTGELINRLSADTQLVSQAVTTQISDGLRSSLMTAAGIGKIFVCSSKRFRKIVTRWL